MLLEDQFLATPVATIAPVWWGVTLIGLVMAGLAGFAVGQWRARTVTRRAVDRAKSSLTNLYGHVCKSVDEAHRACQWLENYPDLQLSLEQVQQLDGKQALFLETMQRLVEGHREAVEAQPPEPVETPDVNWVREPESSVTRLPDRSAFNTNVDLLLQMADESDLRSALLLARMDKTDDLKSRFGIAGIQGFQRKMSSLICRSIRDADIACQFAADTFAVLMPGVDESQAAALSATIRQAVRGHNFRLKDDGPEVLVTASFGVTLIGRGDHADLMLNRTENALKRSRKQGRNQLHVDTGSQLLTCKAV
ncbi:MAG: GGDEF domain-containing protein [Planctomycetaceae bacterium]